MKRKYILYMAMSVLLFFGCGQDAIDIPEPENDGPVFFTELNINGKSIDWRAGEKGYNAITGHTIIGDEIFFTSYIKPSDCNINCPNSIELILGSDILYNREFKMDNALSVGSKEFSRNVLHDSIYIFVRNNSTIQRNGIWRLNRREINPIIIGDTIIFKSPGSRKNELCYEFADNMKNIYRHCQLFYNNAYLIMPRVRIEVSDPRIVELTANRVQPHISDKVIRGWNHEPSKGFILHIQPREISTKEFCFTSTLSGSNNKSISCIKINSDPQRAKSYALFRITKIMKINPSLFYRKEKVDLLYIDEIGEKYWASRGDNIHDSSFEIKKIEPFMDSNSGEDLLRVHINFSCTLYGKDNKEIKIRDASGVFPIRIAR